MEFPDLGENCSHEACKQLDFLPIECIYCKLYFCKEHSLPYHHKCPNIEDRTANDLTVSTESYACTYNGCKDKSLVPVLCDLCGTQFCLKHRAPAAHKCEKDVRPEGCLLTPQEKVESITGKKLCTEKPAGCKGGKKSDKTANKVKQMKLKMKAKGNKNIPVNERIYFSLQVVPKNSEEPMFFDQKLIIGRMIDVISDMLKLKNENHLANSLKLRLLTENDIILPTDKKLEFFLSNEEYSVENFGSLKLDYV